MHDKYFYPMNGKYSYVFQNFIIVDLKHSKKKISVNYRIIIDIAVNSHRLNSHSFTALDHTTSDFTSIGNQDFVEFLQKSKRLEILNENINKEKQSVSNRFFIVYFAQEVDSSILLSSRQSALIVHDLAVEVSRQQKAALVQYHEIFGREIHVDDIR